MRRLSEEKQSTLNALKTKFSEAYKLWNSTIVHNGAASPAYSQFMQKMQHVEGFFSGLSIISNAEKQVFIEGSHFEFQYVLDDLGMFEQDIHDHPTLAGMQEVTQCIDNITSRVSNLRGDYGNVRTAAPLVQGNIVHF